MLGPSLTPIFFANFLILSQFSIQLSNQLSNQLLPTQLVATDVLNQLVPNQPLLIGLREQ